MEIAIKKHNEINLLESIKHLANSFKISNIESKLSNCFENLNSCPTLDYIGEFNKNDVML